MWTAFGVSVNTYFAWLPSGSARTGWWRWPSGSASSSAPRDDARLARHGARELGAVHPRRLRHHPARPGRRVRRRGGGGHVVRAAAGRLDRRRGRPPGGRRAAGLPAGGRPGRGPGGGRRGPLPGRRPVDVPGVRRWHRRGAAPAVVGRPVAGKTGSSDGYATETVVAFTPQLAVAAIAANPDDPRGRGGPAGAGADGRARWGRCSPSRCATSRSGTSCRPARRPPSGLTGARAGN